VGRTARVGIGTWKWDTGVQHTLLLPGGDWSKWSAAFEVKNLTDRLYYIVKFNAGRGFIGGRVGEPRTWMLSLRRDF
jgi:outer membrane receptor protein involved in Fe transport